MWFEFILLITDFRYLYQICHPSNHSFSTRCKNFHIIAMASFCCSGQQITWAYNSIYVLLNKLTKKNSTCLQIKIWTESYICLKYMIFGAPINKYKYLCITPLPPLSLSPFFPYPHFPVADNHDVSCIIQCWQTAGSVEF